MRTANRITASGGIAEFKYLGPGWIGETIGKRLYLFNRINGVDFIGIEVAPQLLHEVLSLPALERLNISQCNQSSFGAGQLAKTRSSNVLKLLNLSRTKFTDEGLAELKHLFELRILNLDDTKITDTGLEQIKEMTQLQRLQLSGTQVSDVGLKHLKELTNLESLALNSTRVTYAGLLYLKDLKALRSLSLLGTQMSPIDRLNLRQAMPDCKINPDP